MKWIHTYSRSNFNIPEDIQGVKTISESGFSKYGQNL